MPRSKAKPIVTEGLRILNDSTEMVDISRLRVHPQNPNEGDMGEIYQAIEENGFYGFLIAQKSTGFVLAGNHRLETLRMMGASEVPVVWLDVDDDRALRILLGDNRINRLGRDNEDRLAEVLASIKNSTGHLKGTGYDEEVLDDLINDIDKRAGGGSSNSSSSDGYDSFTQTIEKGPKGEKPTFGVLVVCEGESDQELNFQRLRDDGYEVVRQGTKPPGVKR